MRGLGEPSVQVRVACWLAGWLSQATLGSNVCLSTVRIVGVGVVRLEGIWWAWTPNSEMGMETGGSS